MTNFFTGLIVSLALARQLHAAAPRPNILLIVSDDQGYADAGFQGSKDIPTPNLDALAQAGVRCTRGYVTAPVCSPSRAGLLTGRYQEKFGHHNNIVVEAGLPIAHLPAGETLLPEVLAKAGYETSMIGKWHLGLQKGFSPHDRGFENFFGFVTGGHDYFVNHPGELAVGDGSYRARIERNGVGVAVPGYLTDAWGDEAVRILRQKRDKPLFLYLAFNAPHTPTQAPEVLVKTMPPGLAGKNRRTYAAQIASLDANLGKVLTALKETGLATNTFIVFFSDNGGAMHPYYDNTPLRDHKGSLYEGGIRVPFLAVYPGHIPPGSVCDTPVITLDVFATVCRLAQAKTTTANLLDSVDMLPVLAGKTKTATHENLFWNFPAFGAAVSSGNLKLVVPKNGENELFDLAADIGEKTDLAKSRPDDVVRLTKLFNDWLAQTVTPLWGPGSKDFQAGKLQNIPPARPPKKAASRASVPHGDLVGETEK